MARGAAARLSGRCRDHSRARREHAGARHVGVLWFKVRPGPTHTRAKWPMASTRSMPPTPRSRRCGASKPGGTNSVIAIVISNTWSIPSTSISARSKAGLAVVGAVLVRIDVRAAIYPGITADQARAQIDDCLRDATSDPRLGGRPPVTYTGFYAEGYVLEPGSDAEHVARVTGRSSRKTSRASPRPAI